MRPIHSMSLFATVIIGDSLGFDVNGSALVFGRIAPGGSSTRTILFYNEQPFSVLLTIHPKGDIAPLLSFEDTVRIEPHEQKRIGFSALAAEHPYGSYNGTVTFDVLPA